MFDRNILDSTIKHDVFAGSREAARAPCFALFARLRSFAEGSSTRMQDATAGCCLLQRIVSGVSSLLLGDKEHIRIAIPMPRLVSCCSSQDTSKTFCHLDLINPYNGIKSPRRKHCGKHAFTMLHVSPTAHQFESGVPALRHRLWPSS